MDKTQIAIEIFDAYAQQYQAKFMKVDLYHESLDAFCNAITKPNPEILEVACGPGNISRYLLDKQPAFRLLGTDLAPNMIELAKENVPEASFCLMDAREISKLGQRYDGIMCGFCLPYLSKLEAIQFIQDAAGLLRKNGILYISTMEDDYERSGWEGPSGDGIRQMYIHYHETSYLLEALKSYGFELLELKQQPYPDKPSTKDLILIAQKV